MINDTRHDVRELMVYIVLVLYGMWLRNGPLANASKRLAISP
jgi:hypothetical protein